MERGPLDDQMRRLVLARWLTKHVGDAVGEVVPADTSRENLEELAARLDRVEARPPFPDVRFAPPYPGRVAEDAGGARLVLECAVAAGEVPLGVVLTVLIAGRRPQVSIAPPSARVPRHEG